MSFSEDFDRHREPLLRMAVADVPVVSAAGALWISSGRAYEILRAAGRGSGRAKTKITAEHRSAVLAVFAESARI